MKTYNSNIRLGVATLNVENLEKQIEFYTTALGMSVLEKDDSTAVLGTKDGSALLRLQVTDHKFVHSYGLYHIAYLVPSEQDLADILRHFVRDKVLLEGAADHGYSNAIYLHDAEENGIEVYYDKDESAWDKREDGRIVGVTDPLDAEHLLNISKDVVPYELPNGTIIGHMHLSVRNSKKSSEFYQTVLNFLDKFSMPTGSWLAHGGYHHHLAVNQWAGSSLNDRQKGFPGLAYFDIIVTTGEEFASLVQNIKATNTTIVKETTDSIFILDPNGIEVHLIRGE